VSDPRHNPLLTGVFRRVLWAGTCIVLSTGLGCGLIVWDGVRDDLHQADVGVVLGNKVEPDGRPSNRLKARLDLTVELYRSKFFPAILVSGGVGKEGFDEAVVMRDYLVECGIPSQSILLDSKGINTAATAENTQALSKECHWHSALVITQYFHVSRSVLAMRRAGIPSVYSAGAKYFEWRDLYSIPRELAGYVAHWFKSFDVD